ncbi:hypothetical protein AB4238_22290 [Shewanella sp. 10N.286.45.A1]|uniref:hypothetical protein n=1 Tax=Shewanella sp. 10N.286.45.A1 TaxID=3229694 RepID=UPI003552CF2C
MFKSLPFITLLVTTLLSQTVTAQTLAYLIISEQAEPFQVNAAEAGPQTGVVTDIVEFLANKKPFEIVNQVMPFKRYLYEMEKQTFPNWISYGSPTWRVKDGKYLQNKRLSKQVLFTANHIAVSLKADSAIVWPQLQHKTLILLKGFKYPGLEPLIEQYQIKVLEVSSHKSALLALQSRRGDLFIEMKSRVLYSLNKHQINPTAFVFTDINDTIAPVDIHLSYGDGVPQGLIDWNDEQILIMKAHGIIDDILDKYQ